MDPFVYRWFLFLISQPTLRSRGNEIPGLAEPYSKIDKINRELRLLFLPIFIFLLIFLMTGKWFLFLPVLAGGALLYTRRLEKKKEVADISLIFIERDFPPEVLAQKTLYQIGEVYSNRYRVLSLVDAIYNLDKIYRFTLVFSFLLAAYILDIKVWGVKQALFIGLYLLVVWLANMSFFYKKFR